ncbi:MAG: apolipoprotein N-acyltransferase [Actinobacteria bacterium]|nr:apolipoprotein N-acyltransferase [Actinomycetota bacterium]MCB9412540.1 apolipoprotein N-acyltransferase [Actinomycetota bacterium]
MSLSLRVLLAVLGGLTCALAFPEPGLPWAAPVGVAVMTAAWWRAPWRHAVLAGYLGGLAFNLVLLSWLRVLGVDAWLALAVGWSVWWILLGLGTAAATWLRGWWPLAVAGLWVLVEALRGRMPWGGFPWGRLAFANSDTVLTPWSAVLGSAAVTALVAGIGAMLLVIVREAYSRRFDRALGAIGIVAVLALSGVLIPLPTVGQGSPAYVPLAVVQGSVPRIGLTEGAQRRAVLDNHVTATLELAERVQRGEEPAPAAVIWPENSSDVNPYTDSAARAQIDIAAKAIGVPILVGAVVEAGEDTLYNVGIVWDPQLGPTDEYIKQHPVPFGEYLPGRSLLTSVITRFDRIPKDFVGGPDSGVLQLGPARIGDIICFEVAYDSLVSDTVLDGARVLVVQTNNATYAGTSQPAQQVAMSRLRAVEHGRSVLIAATSGITAVITPSGDVVEQLPEQVSGSIVADVPMRDSLTIADTVKWGPEALLAVIGLAGWVVGAMARRRALGSKS